MKSPNPPPPPPGGGARYPRYGRELARTICERIAHGESWSQMSKEIGMPSYTTLYLWKKKHPAFAAQLEQARQAGADWKFDQVWDIAEAVPGEGVPQAKLKIDALRWQTTQRAAAKDAKAADDDRKVILNIQVVRFADLKPETP